MTDETETTTPVEEAPVAPIEPEDGDDEVLDDEPDGDGDDTPEDSEPVEVNLEAQP